MSTKYDFHSTSSTNIHWNFYFQRFFEQQCDIISKKFSAFNLAGKFINFSRTPIANQNYKLAVAAKSTNWGKFFKAVFRWMKNVADLAVLADKCPSTTVCPFAKEATNKQRMQVKSFYNIFPQKSYLLANKFNYLFNKRTTDKVDNKI